MIDGDGSSRWTMKSMQNQKVAKTSGESKNVEGRTVAKIEIIKNKGNIKQFWQPQIGACAKT